ncbi:DUF1501 domain-containing protein [Blastopirellula sp. JC732]|uniref:DUF1501 domain-containing protein n=1 Tax=Blastopirellula sediminis TaxID=2894196 RepID=A0A9X1MHZ6_9BACT|nr:DUF1501 domain-containing protein [Blastopirellula sediminis]MCC9609706.1 DUF1501 domain-containing protein [Blastopirellula sediminis]MCC9627518.1 DUF1501 domain-containing protein [Blastopirellula sediminis]
MPTKHSHHAGCGGADHFSRRTLLKAAGGLPWLTPLAAQLAAAAEADKSGAPAKSVIVLWMQGGPSQLETFDPHPGTMIGGDTKRISTSSSGVEISDLMPSTAEIMNRVALLRGVTSKEGDHERATYNMKTGYRPDPTLIHPSIGAVMCHELSSAGVEIPRHVSIFPNQWPGHGGFLGNKYDAFKTYDPLGDLPDLPRRVGDERFAQRRKDLDILERTFTRNRRSDLEKNRTLHLATIDKAITMMDSEQIKAFNIEDASQSLRDDFGDTPFGRGCLCAVQLIETGVRCVEVTLGGWDTHANNHQLQSNRIAELDPAFSALIRLLEERDLLKSTVVLCGGEFGRTPKINPAAGRDHWPHGFSVALAGGGIRGGALLGETDPEGEKVTADLTDAVGIADIHATIYQSLGINFHHMYDTPIGRPMAISDGKPIASILA